jgi:hypothetical protein
VSQAGSIAKILPGSSLGLRSTPGYDPNRTASREALLSWGLPPLQRIKRREATNTGLTSPGCATPAGFLNPLTLCSSRIPSGFVSRRCRSWGSPFRGFPPWQVDRASRHRLPLLAFWSASRSPPGVPPRPEGPDRARVTNPAPKSVPRPAAYRAPAALRRGPPKHARLRTARTRLQGFEPTRDPFVRSAMVSRTTGADPLLGFQPSRVCSLPATTRPTPRSPPMCFPNCVPKQAARRHFGVSVSRKVGQSLSRPTDPRGFCVLVSTHQLRTLPPCKHGDRVPAEASSAQVISEEDR